MNAYSDFRRLYTVFVQRGISLGKIVALAKQRGIVIKEVNDEKLASIAGTQKHGGVAASLAVCSYATVEEILAVSEEKGKPPFIIIADEIEDPHNLGAIIRSAECCGAHGIIIPKRRAVGLTGTVGKASAGAIEHMRVAKVTNLATTVDELKDKGLWIFAADMGGEPHYDTDMTCGAAIVLGSEGSGISRLVKEKCDFTVSIPLYGSVNSMNVSCAAAVILAEVARQRSVKGR